MGKEKKNLLPRYYRNSQSYASEYFWKINVTDNDY